MTTFHLFLFVSTFFSVRDDDDNEDIKSRYCYFAEVFWRQSFVGPRRRHPHQRRVRRFDVRRLVDVDDRRRFVERRFERHVIPSYRRRNLLQADGGRLQ